MSSSPTDTVSVNVASHPVPISADGSSLLHHTAEDVATYEPTGTVQFEPSANDLEDATHMRSSFRTFFDIVPTAHFLHRQIGCDRVGLQFPDEWMTFATQIVKELKQEIEEMRQQDNEKEKDETAANAAHAATSNITHASSSTPPRPPLMFYILADTSYGSCCVDEVAAQHANCDIIVHYGFSCLSSTRRLPVRYVFGRKSLDLDAMVNKVFEPSVWAPPADNHDEGGSFFSFSYTPAPSAPTVDPATLPPTPVLFLYNLEYAHLVNDGAIQSKLHQFMTNRSGQKFVVSVARIRLEREKSVQTNHSPQPLPSSSCQTGSCNTDTAASTACCTPSNQSSCCGGKLDCSSTDTAAPSATPASADFTHSPILYSNDPSLITGPLSHFDLSGYSFSFPATLVSTKELLSKVHIVWLGDSIDKNKLLTNAMLVYNSNPFHFYHTKLSRFQWEVKSQSKTLARRYYLMEKAKNASIVGILVGTLGVSDYLTVISALKSALLHSGKKSYTFVVGKLNEPKLSNFGEIDLFVLVACPLNTMFDSSGYYRDVITPFELICALKGWEWNGQYSTDFKTILDSNENKFTTSAANGEDDQSSASNDLTHGMRYDPITGKMRSALPSQLFARGISLSSAGEDGPHADASASSLGQIVRVDGQELVRVDGGALVQLTTASDFFLAQRTFRGLKLKHENEEDGHIAKIEPGLDGIARKYKQTQLEPAQQEKDAAIGQQVDK